MLLGDKKLDVSIARQQKRMTVISASTALLDSEEILDFDPIHFPLCAVDVVLIAGAPWLMEGLTRDFYKDESGYRKIGGGANTPLAPYFFRSVHNLVHFLKRQNLYYPRGSLPPEPGMACFLDWEDRGRFNFAPDRSGIVTACNEGHITEVILAAPIKSVGPKSNYRVQKVSVQSGDIFDRALIGYSDLP